MVMIAKWETVTKNLVANKSVMHQGSVAGSVIQAIGTVEFEDGLRTGGCWGP